MNRIIPKSINPIKPNPELGVKMPVRTAPKLLVPIKSIMTACHKCLRLCPTDVVIDKNCPSCYSRDRHAKRKFPVLDVLVEE